MIKPTLSWGSIIDELGGTTEVAGALEQLLSVVSGWRSRGIPSWHWAAIVRLAAKQDKPKISFELLADLAAARFAESRT